MKRIFFCSVFLLLIEGIASAQVSRQQKKTSKKTVVKKGVKSGSGAKQTDKTITVLSSVNAYPAKTNLSSSRAFTINDPLLRAFNEKAKGNPVQISNSGIAGMPKRAYGFANGRLIFNSTGATSSGTVTGSGLVGTGSSLGVMGSSGSRVGLNGKSPYAGSTMWGNARGLLILRGDSAVRRF